MDCQPTISQAIPCGSTSALVNFPATATDNCGPASVTYSSQGATRFSSQSQSTARMNIGSSTIITTARDGAGNEATCFTQVLITAGKVLSHQIKVQKMNFKV